uniref:Uncharacterized protein n=1 Tax=Phlebotomus papatasi TaxID=29031 RepID=A0A1B0GQK8_PHLPP
NTSSQIQQIAPRKLYQSLRFTKPRNREASRDSSQPGMTICGRNCPHTLMPRGMPSPSIVSEFFTFIRDTPIFASYFSIYSDVLFVCLIKKGTLFVLCTK